MKQLITICVLVGLIFAVTAQVALAATEVQKQTAIDKGLEWLARRQQGDGRFAHGYNSYLDCATTAAVLQAFLNKGYTAGSDVIINSNNYGDVIGNGLNFIFSRAQQAFISPQPAGDPDVNGNGIGIYFNVSSYYAITSGMVIRAIVLTGTPKEIITTGSQAGRTYRDFVQDMVDYLAFAQTDYNFGAYRGGWRYYANYSSSDQEMSVYPPVAMTLAERQWGIIVPQFVKDELRNWINYIQYSDGGAGYTTPGNYRDEAHTAGLLMEMTFVGAPYDTSHYNVQIALNFLNHYWTRGFVNTYDGNFGHPYAMWRCYIGLGAMIGLDDTTYITNLRGSGTIDPGDTPNWYEDYCQYLVTYQYAAGYWNPYTSYWGETLTTAWFVDLLNAEVSWTISGYVTAGGAGLEGVLVSADNDGGSDTTDGNGYYELEVSDGWSGTVTPTKNGWLFNPPDRSYSDVISDQSNQNFSACAAAVHNINKGEDYCGIQEAIDDADPYDTITVASGTYYETVIVDKAITLTGEGRDTTIIDGGSSGDVVQVTADYVNITGFTVTGAGGTGWPDYDAGILLSGVQNCRIENCRSTSNNRKGIYLVSSSYNDILSNDCSSNDYYCIRLSSSSNNTISGNTCTNSACGVSLTSSSTSNDILNNNCSSNWANGIMLDASSNSNIMDNNNCTGTGSTYEAIRIHASSGNTVRNCTCSYSNYGLHLTSASSNHIYNNEISNTNTYGIRILSASGNVVCYCNFINNNSHAIDTTGSNIWDNGYPSGGNYWDTYAGADDYHGPGQDIPGSDGIVDTPYTGSSGVVDNYPWLAQYGTKLIISGYITQAEGGSGLAGVQVSGDGVPGPYTSLASGYYKLEVPDGWSGTVTPTKVGWGFDPTDRTYSGVTSDQTNQDFTAHVLLVTPTQTEKQAAIEAGLEWLAQNQQADGRWLYDNVGSASYDTAVTGVALEAFLEAGYRAGTDVILNHVNYGDVVGQGLDYVFSRASQTNIAPQPAGDPDTNGNGIGVFFGPQTISVYNTSMVTSALIATGTPDEVISTGPLAGLTYKDAIQDAIDYLAYGQNDFSWPRGGWRFSANQGSSGNENSPWPCIAMVDAEQKMGGVIVVPEFVKDELNYWIAYIQYRNPGHPLDGSSGFTNPTLLNSESKTGGLLVEMMLAGDSVGDDRVQAALGYLNREWPKDTYSTWYGNFGNPYAMIQIQKGLAMTVGMDDTTTITNFRDPDKIDPCETWTWSKGYQRYLVDEQLSDGSWADYSYTFYDGPLATAWGVSILQTSTDYRAADKIILDFEDVATAGTGSVWMPPWTPYHDIASMEIMMAYEVGSESWVRSMNDANGNPGSWSVVNWGDGYPTRSIVFDGEVDFHGAWFTWGQTDYLGNWVAAKWVQIVGKDKDGGVVGTTEQLWLDDTFQYLEGKMNGVKTLEITSFNDEYDASYYQMDNLEYLPIPDIYLLDPNGSSVLLGGKTHTISWGSFGDVGNVVIEYSSDNGDSWMEISSDAANTGSYDWAVPQITSEQCLMHIADTTDANVSDTSEVFSIYAVGAPEDLYACWYGSDKVIQYDDATGIVVAPFVLSAAGPYDVEFGPNGNLFVGSQSDNCVLEYDGTTGELVGIFVASGYGGLSGLWDMAFGPNGNLFVLSSNNKSIIEYDGNTGTLVSSFAIDESNMPCAIAFSPNGNLFVASFRGHSILEYDVSSGAFVGTIVSDNELVRYPSDIEFGPDDNLYIASWSNRSVVRYDDGQLTTFVSTASGELSCPREIEFAPDGTFYIADWYNHKIKRYDGLDGSYIDTFASGDGILGYPSGIAFKYTETSGFQEMGTLEGGEYSEAGGISADGMIVVGMSDSTEGEKAFRWSEFGGMQSLSDVPDGTAQDVSANGAVVVGKLGSGSQSRAFRWTDTNDIEYLTIEGEEGQASGVSDDGEVVVGVMKSNSKQAFRWTRTGGRVGLGHLPGGGVHSEATDTSSDGEVVVGMSDSVDGNEAFIWTDADGMTGLGDLPGGDFYSKAHAVSKDGKTVVGKGKSASGEEAFRWTADGGMVGLGDLPGGDFYSEAFAVSADGNTVVGMSKSDLGEEAFIWDPHNGIRKIKDIMEQMNCCPAVEAINWHFLSAKAISEDGEGLTITGSGLDPGNNKMCWRLRIRICVPPCISDLNKDCNVNMYDIALLGSAWLSSAGDGNWNPAYDISDPNDNTIDELDLDVLTDNWLWEPVALPRPWP